MQRQSSDDVIVKLADTLAKYTTSNKKTPEEVLAEIPAGVDGYLPSAKLQATIKTIDPDFPTADLEQITSEFCKKGDDNVDILGLKKQLRPAISKKLQDMLMKRRENDEDLNALVIQSIILYLRKNHLTLYDLYKKIDSNHDNLVTYQEFDSFLRGLEIALSSEQLSKLLSEFDKKKEENIRFDNFVDTLKPYMIERPEAPSTVDEVLLYVAAYIKENNISTTELFSSLDMNQDGFVSRKELGEVLFKVNVPNDEAKIKEIFDHFDRNHDNRVSIKEFVDIVKPYLEKAEVFASIPHSKVHSNEATPKDLADVKKKLAGVLNSEYHTLEKVFPIFSQDGSEFITEENFIKVLKDLRLGFTKAEVDLILDRLVEHNGKKEVNWQRFLGSEAPASTKTKSNESNHSNPGTSDNVSNTPEQIFRRISKILNEQGISAHLAFKIFDKDGSGKITLPEFKQAFNSGMKLGLTDEEINGILKKLDNNGDGSVDYNEFLKALSL